MMTLLSHLLSTSLLLPLATALAVPTTRDLPECSQTSAQPCKCPAGTTYNTCTTYVTVGANAYDVRNLTGDYFDLGWIPQRIKETHGEDNTVGCTRKTSIAIDVGVYEWVEELIEYELGFDGSFLWEFKLNNVPLYFHPGPGLFAGEWVTWKAEYLSEYETKISWNLYGCHSGGMHGYSEFQRYIMRHVQSLLRKDGKIKGNNTDPYSEIGAPRKMSLASPVVAEGAESSSPMRHNQQVLDGDKSASARISAASSSASCAKDSSAAVESRLLTAWTPL